MLEHRLDAIAEDLARCKRADPFIDRLHLRVARPLNRKHEAVSAPASSQRQLCALQKRSGTRLAAAGQADLRIVTSEVAATFSDVVMGGLYEMEQ
jgi:hypothetical protein